MAKKRSQAQAELDMTPMIDVVFQLIIFFVVTLKMSDDRDKTVLLADGRRGIEVNDDSLPKELHFLTIDVAKDGRISYHDMPLTDKAKLNGFVKDWVRKYGSDFPCLIRADGESIHKNVSIVMQTFAANGLYKMTFVAVGRRKTEKK